MAGAIIKSVLEEAVAKLQATGAKGIKKQSLISKLNNEQVKSSESSFSGTDIFLAKFGDTQQVPLKDLQNFIDSRKDTLQTGVSLINDSSMVSDGPTRFKRIREAPFSKKDFGDQLYQEDVFTKQATPTVSNHFNIDNYFSHVRFTDVNSNLLDAKATASIGSKQLENARYIHEIQSDVNQGAKDVKEFSKEDKLAIRSEVTSITNKLLEDKAGVFFPSLDSSSVISQDKLSKLTEMLGTEVKDLIESGPEVISGQSGILRIANTLGVSPEGAAALQKSILRAADQVKEVKGGFSFIDFKQDPGYLKSTVNKMLVDSANAGQSIVKVRIAPDPKLLRSEGVQEWYRTAVVNTLRKAAKQIGAPANMTSDGYFRIELPNKFKLPLYSLGGVTVMSAGPGEAQAQGEDIVTKQEINNSSTIEALKGGFDQTTITNEMAKQGIDPNNADNAIRTIVNPQEGTIGKDLPADIPTDPTVDAQITNLNNNVINIDKNEISKALQQNFSPQDIQAEMVKQGIDPAQALDAVMSVADPIGQQNIVNEQALQISSQEDLSKEILDPSSMTLGNLTENQLSTVLDNKSAELKSRAEDDASKFDNIARKYSALKFVKSLTGDLPSTKELSDDSANVTEFIYQNLQADGFDIVKMIQAGPKTIIRDSGDPKIGDILPNTQLGIRDANGNITELDIGILRTLRDSKLEIAGSVAGRVIGAAAGTAALGAIIPPVTPPSAIAKLLLVGTSTLLTGAIGAGAGRGLDITINAMQVKEQIDSKQVMAQMVDAGYSDALFGIVGAGVLKISAKALRGAFTVARSVGRVATDTLPNVGISTGKAERAIIRTLGINENEAKTIVQKWAKLNAVRLEDGNGPVSEQVAKLQRQENLGILITSSERGKGILASATARSVVAANTVSAASTKRASDLLNQVTKLSDPNVTRRVVEDLTDYTTGLESAYSNAKEIGGKVVGEAKFKFDYDKVLYKPLARQLSSTIQNPAKFSRVDNFVQSVAETSQKRDFKSLLDTRTQINDFARSNTDIDAVQKKVLKSALGRLDSLIRLQSSSTVDGKIWHTAYKKTLLERDRMFKVKGNVLFKALTKAGTSTQDKAKSFAKFIQAEDGSYAELVARLPAKTRDKVEVEVGKELVKKHSVSSPTTGEVQAVNFVSLGNDMANYAFTSTEAKRLKTVVNQLSVVYKNDLTLARVSGSVLSGGSGGISEQVIGRINAALVKNVFDGLTQLLPTKTAGEKVLVSKLSKILENPFEQRSVNNLFQALEGPANTRSITTIARDNIEQSIKQLQIEHIKAGVTGRPDVLKTKGFATTKVGKERVVRNGKLGFGVYYKLDRSTASKQLRTALERISTREVPAYRVADEELVSKLLGKIPTAAEVKAEQGFIKRELEEAGYLGYKFGNDMLLFN